MTIETTRRAFLLGTGAVAAAAVLPAAPAEALSDGWVSAGIDMTVSEPTTGIHGVLPTGRYVFSTFVKPLEGKILNREALIAEGFDLVDVGRGFTRITKTFDQDASGQFSVHLPGGWYANFHFSQIDDVDCTLTVDLPEVYRPSAKCPIAKPARSGFDWRAEQRNKHKRRRHG